MNASRHASFHCTVLAVFLATTLTGQDIRKDPLDSRRTLTVTGNGEASAAPDHAVVRLGASAQAEEAAAAQINVNEVMQKALGAIEKVGIAKKSVRTSGLTLTPIYSPNKGDRSAEPRIVAYRAGNTIEVTVEDIKLVGKVIDAGLTAGANRLEGVSFGLKNDLPQRRAALTSAVEEARAKAQTMARALDISLGNVREVVEGGVHIFRQERFAAARGMMAADAMQTPVEPGEVRVQASVTIHYDLGK
jgi:uncharacterized protein YggE